MYRKIPTSSIRQHQISDTLIRRELAMKDRSVSMRIMLTAAEKPTCKRVRIKISWIARDQKCIASVMVVRTS